MNTGELLQCTSCNKQFEDTHQLECHILEILITGNSDSFCRLLYKSVQLDQLFKTWEIELQEHLLLQNDKNQA